MTAHEEAPAEGGDTDLAVLVPTKDRPQQLARLLSSLRAAGVEEVVVFDDGSTVPVELPHDPAVTVLRSSNSLMVSGARNALASATDAPYFVFIDDDVVVEPGCVAALGRALHSDPRIGMVGPVIGYLDDPDTIWCAGVGRDRWTGRTRFVAQGQPLTAAYGLENEAVDFPTAFGFSRECWDAVRGFDAALFPFHMAESEISDRVRRAGFGVRLVPDAVLWHDMSSQESLARKLHIPSPARASMVGRDRGRFIRLQQSSFEERWANLAFWLLVLVPAQALTLLTESGTPMPERLQRCGAFVRGALVGVFGGLPSDPAATRIGTASS